MPAPRKLTDEQIQYARAQVAGRRDALARAAAYPTIVQLAALLDVTPRYLREVVNGRARLPGAEQREQNAIDSATANLLT